VSSLADLITERLQPALAALLTAFDYAADSGADRWEFAVEMTELLASGAALADLRWLILRNFAEHSKETTTPGDPDRSFRPLAPTAFPPDACLVLTPAGANTLRPFVARRVISPSPISGEGRGEGASSPSARREPVERTAKGQPAVSLPNGGGGARSPSPFSGEGRGEGAVAPSPQSLAPSPSRPKWHSDLHELHFNGSIIKRFKLPARNQELILAAFEEEGWPNRIDDPLPQNGDLDPRQRLRNTIVTLNRHQLEPLLHFRCDGTGRGVLWERRKPHGDCPDFVEPAM
jgi:hypothetical protein